MIDTTSARFMAALEAGRRAFMDPALITNAEAAFAAQARAIIASWEASKPSVWHAPTEADQDGHPYWVQWTDIDGTWHGKAYFDDGHWWTSVTTTVEPDQVMRLPMGSE